MLQGTFNALKIFMFYKIMQIFVYYIVNYVIIYNIMWEGRSVIFISVNIDSIYFD